MNYLLTNKITALFMGKTDLHTGLWFPYQKMTWETKKGTNYINLTIKFLEGTRGLKELYPNSTIDYGRIMNYRDISYCPWRNRMHFPRSMAANDSKIYDAELEFYGFGFDNEVDPIEYVVISGGYRHGDKSNLFPELAPDEKGNYNFIFRGQDAWYFSQNNSPEIEAIPLGAKVTLQPPAQEKIKKGEWKEHTAPPEAIRMKMFAEGKLVGYAPPYIRELYKSFGENLQVVTCAKNLGVQFDDQFIFKAMINQRVGIPFSELRYQPFKAESEKLKSTIYG